jgi:protoheme ferro-lyase
MPTRHVVLVTYGEPPTPSFVDQLVYSWRILLGLTRKVDAIPRPLLPMIALARARGRRALWREHGYASPLEPITQRQAQVLRGLLGEDTPGESWRLQVAYEYRAPLLADVLKDIPSHEHVWVVPLYAADSAFTHELSREAASTRSGPVSVLGALSADRLAAISAAHVLEQAGREPGWLGNDVALVLAAHGTVLTPPKPIETGLIATEALCQAVGARLAPHFGMVVNGWLNHTRGGKWTEPPIEEALAQVAAAGYSRVVYYPYGFLGDNAESELEGRIALAGVPALAAKHLPCLNDSPRLLDLLAQQVRQCADSCAPAPDGASEAACYRLCMPGAVARATCGLCAMPGGTTG